MPQVEVTREELEALIDAVTLYRVNGGSGDAVKDSHLPTLHNKLEEFLERWIYGGEESLPITPAMRAMGICGWTLVHPPHDEGLNGR